MSQDPKQKSNISSTTATLMISVALLVDVLLLISGLFNFIPALGNVVSLFLSFMINTYASLTFITWFFIIGEGFVKPNRIVVKSTAIILGFIPFVNMLPWWTISTILLIAFIRGDEKISSLKGEKVSA
ncbi:MAG: hypothetical protein ACLFNR_02050 [Candidatus Paceibacterota bacterium]